MKQRGGVMTVKILVRRLVHLALLLVALGQLSAVAQTQSAAGREKSDEKIVQVESRPNDSAGETDDQYFKDIYRHFYHTYKLGPDDVIAVRIVGQPDYSLERVVVSPVGRIYHPLIGDVEVARLTVTQVTNKLAAAFSQYVLDPQVSVSLIDARSAKIGVLGDVSRPGVVIMTAPMTVLDAISASGGITTFGSQSNVTLLRQLGDGRMNTLKVNVKRIVQGKADPEENVTLRAGDTIIVHGNFKKKLSYITSLVGFGQFVAFVAK